MPKHFPAQGLHLWDAHSTSPRVESLTSPRFWLIPGCAFLVLALLALSGVNQQMFLAFNELAAALPDVFWSSTTSLGDTLVAFAILLPFLRRRPDAAAAAILAVLLATLGTHGLKYLLAMPRPLAVLDVNLINSIGPQLGSRSFPSGHTTAAFTVAALLGGYTLRWYKFLPIILAAALVGISRIAVGAHWPTDVLAGMLIGWLAGFAGLHLAPYCRICQSRAVHYFTLALFAASTLWLLTGFQSGYLEARWVERTVALVALLAFLFPLFVKRTQTQPSRP